MHRALARLSVQPRDVIGSMLAFVLATVSWLACLTWVCKLWAHILRYGVRTLHLQCAPVSASQYVVPYLNVSIPYLQMNAGVLGSRAWVGTCLVTLLLFAGTLAAPARFIAVTYLIRTILFVQMSALCFFAIAPTEFPYTTGAYVEGLAVSGVGLISIIPLLYAAIYYVFNFAIWKKLALTMITMAYLVVFLPIQIVIQALVLQQSIIFMPVLYIVFGIPLDVLIVVACYSYGMTWSVVTDNGT